MSQIAKLLLPTGLAMSLISCFEREVFPDTPQIAYKSLRYVDTDRADSLILRFSFQDGNGDIGLSPDERSAPFHNYSLVVDAGGTVLYLNTKEPVPPFTRAPAELETIEGEQVVFYDPEPNPYTETDPRPAYNCHDYEIVGKDTLYVIRNELSANFHIDFLRKKNGKYHKIDLRKDFFGGRCTGSFSGRIPLLGEDANEGTITYSMLSQGFRLIFKTDPIKVRFFIYDRALNKSNVVESDDFVLTDPVE